MDYLICPTDIICGVLSSIGICCCCYWGVAMRYETPALQQTDYHYNISNNSDLRPSLLESKLKSKSKLKSNSEQKQYNSDNIITEENQLELPQFYGNEPNIVTKLPEEYKGENDEGIFTSARFLRMFSKSVLQTSPHNTEYEQNTHLNESQKSYEVHSPTINERNVKNMIKLPPIMSQHNMYVSGQRAKLSTTNFEYDQRSSEKFGQGSKGTQQLTPDYRLDVQSMFAENTDGYNTGKIPESSEPCDMVPVHYKIQKKSPKNITGNGQRPPNIMNFENNQILNFVHKKKSIFFSNASSPHSSEVITGVMLGTKKTSQNEIIPKSYKTPQTPRTPRTPPQTPRLEAQKSVHDIRMNNASNFILSL